jgi:hypothetical protein
VDAEAVGGDHVVQKDNRMINHERVHCHIESGRLFHRAYSPRIESYGVDCQTVEEKPVDQETYLI